MVRFNCNVQTCYITSYSCWIWTNKLYSLLVESRCQPKQDRLNESYLFHINRTPLHYAVQYGNIESMRLLLEAGSKANVEDAARFMPLHLAANIGDVSKCELLTQYKADINAADDTGETPLHWAATSQRLEVVEFLLSKGVNTDLRDMVGRTPLHIAFYFENRAIIQLLIDSHADLTIRDVCFLFCFANLRIWGVNQMKLQGSKTYDFLFNLFCFIFLTQSNK